MDRNFHQNTDMKLNNNLRFSILIYIHIIHQVSFQDNFLPILQVEELGVAINFRWSAFCTVHWICLTLSSFPTSHSTPTLFINGNHKGCSVPHVSWRLNSFTKCFSWLSFLTSHQYTKTSLIPKEKKEEKKNHLILS